MSKQTPGLYEFGPFRLNAAERTLVRGVEVVPLGPKVFDTLLLLVESGGHLLGKDELLKRLWPDNFVEESSLSQNIFLLRKAMGESTGTPEQRYIETVPKIGYRFVAQVKRLEAIPDDNTIAACDSEIGPVVCPGKAFSVQPPEPESQSLRIPSTVMPRRRLGRRLSLACALLACAVLLIYFSLQRSARRNEAAFNPQSIAVLPFKQVGAGSSDELLGLGMADATISKLSNLHQISVRPTSAVFKYTERQSDPLAAGRELGVDAVLDGTVQHADEHIRVTVQLISISDGRIVWAGKFDERLTDIFALQDSISAQVAQALPMQINVDERKSLVKRYTEKTEAYQSYIMGIYFWNQRSKEGLNKAVEYFQQAIAADPNYALAYAQLADAYFLLGYYEYSSLPLGEIYAKAKASATKALELDGTLAEAHTAMAMVQMRYDKDSPGAMKSIRRAIEINPNNSTAHLRYAWFLVNDKQLNEALQEMRRAQELDPLSPTNNTALAAMFIYSRRYDEALKYSRKAVELDPNFYGGRLNLGLAYEQAGLYDEAIAEYRKAGELNGDGLDALARLGHAFAMAGRRAPALKVLRELQARANQDESTPYGISLIYAALNQKERAFAWLHKAATIHALLTRDLRFDPQLDVLRTDPKFVEFLEAAS
jgi:TolB-like protein/DNA-binding winged helix-turn-helix (wHTH) protein/Flp pilus assembly protein TadD